MTRRRGHQQLVLRNVRPYGEAPVDVRLEQAIITEIGVGLRVDGDAHEVDCAHLVALPGLVDLHAHLREPGGGDAETIYTGTRAAVAGGYSAVFAMANTNPVIDTAARAEAIHRHAAEVGACDVYQVGAVTKGLAGKNLTALEELAGSEARVTVFSDDGHCVFDAVLMREALARIGAIGGVLAQHAQCPQLAAGGQVNAGVVAESLGLAPWPPVAEAVIVARDMVLLEEAADKGARLHICHVSTLAAVELVRWAKQRGLPLTAEVTPHHLALLDDRCLSGDTRFKVNPPLRNDSDRQAVCEALADGTIDVVATDHAPHSLKAKGQGWCDAPPGMLGLETALPLVVDTMVRTGFMNWRQLASAMSTRPAEIGGIGERHGRPLAVGEPATFCLVDPQLAWTVDATTLRSIGKNTPFEGMELSCKVVANIVRGEVTYDPGERFLVSGDV